MTQTNPTTTAQATVLTEEQLANIESTLDTYVQHLRKVDTEWARTMAMNVVRSHRALTEQARVLEDQLTDCQVERDDHFVELGRARRALAALEGSGEK